MFLSALFLHYLNVKQKDHVKKKDMLPSAVGLCTMKKQKESLSIQAQNYQSKNPKTTKTSECADKK